MLFNSYEFILLFLPATLSIYYLLAAKVNNRMAKYFLILASLAFYSYWNINNLPILLTSIAVNYYVGSFLVKNKSKAILWIGIIFNLAFLGYFKYTDFLFANLNDILSLNIQMRNIALPLGISFFTFTQTAYLVDVYRGGTAGYSKSDCLLFVTIFPHLIAGPILYHKDMIPQFSQADRYKINYKNLSLGLVWFIIGLFKKVRIADTLGEYADVVFNNVTDITMLDAWFGSLAYTLQLYFDFSGYSEMAIGLGLMLNYNLPMNFNSPYRASSMIDFWRRWHMTLSAFLKNYLYIPLGGNRNGHHLRNIMFTMLLGGLWHGAGWTYIFWGGLHGFYICINHLWRRCSISLPRFINWLLTFNAVNIAWVFFRANSFSDARWILYKMTDISSLYLPYNKFLSKILGDEVAVAKICYTYKNMIIILTCAILCIKIIDTNELIKKFSASYYWVIGLGLTAAYLLLFMSNVKSQFIYFQF